MPATVNGILTDARGSVLADTTVTFLPQSTPIIPAEDMEQVITSPALSVVSDSGGDFSITLEKGDYRVTIGDYDSFLISVTVDTGSLNIGDITTTSLAYTASLVPGQYPVLSVAGKTGVVTLVPADVVGCGDVIGPSSVTADRIVVFNGTTGKLVKESSHTIASLGAAITLDSLSNVTITSIASGEILKWNGSAWVNNTLAEAGIAAGADYVAKAGDTISGNLLFSGDRYIYNSANSTSNAIRFWSGGEQIIYSGTHRFDNTIQLNGSITRSTGASIMSPYTGTAIGMTNPIRWQEPLAIEEDLGVSGVTVFNASNSNTSLATATIYGHDAADEALVIQGASSQTADLLQFQNDSATSLLAVTNEGVIEFPNNASIKPEIYCNRPGQPLRIIARDDVVIDIAHLNDGNTQDFRVTGKDETETYLTIGEHATYNSQVTAYGRYYFTSTGTNQGTGHFNFYANDSGPDAVLYVSSGSSQDTLAIFQYGGTATQCLDRTGKTTFFTPASSPVTENATLTVHDPSSPTAGLIGMIQHATHSGDVVYLKNDGGTKLWCVHANGLMTVNGSSSLATTTIYGHDDADEALMIRANTDTPSAAPVVVQKSGGGALFSVGTRTTGCITIGEQPTPTKDSHIFAQYAQTDPTGDIMGVYMNEYAVVTSAGSPSLRGVWIENGSAYVNSGITWSGPCYIGFYGTQYVNSANHQGTIQNQYGSRMAVGINACGTGGAVTSAYAFHAEVVNNDADGTITNAYGLYITNSQTTGTITNRYGIYVNRGSAVLTNHLEGILKVVGAANYEIEEVSGDTTLDHTHYTVLVDASGGEVDINLPAANTVTGRKYIIKKTDSSSNNVTIDPNGSETIDGASTFAFNSQYRAVTIQSDGSNWHIVSSYIVNY